MSDGYEIHSILEFGDRPTPGLWWVLSPNGKSPIIRAGAASLVLKGGDGRNYDESVVFSGGATPAGFISQVTKLDMVKGEWVQMGTTGFEPRYEHAMCLINNELTILLGTGNDASPTSQTLTDEKWHERTDVNISSRTVAQQAQVNDKTYIYSGGCAQGVVPDQCLYVIENGSVRREKLCGDIPQPRQECAMCADETHLYIHGGISAAGVKLDDLYRISLSSFRSKKINIEGSAGDMTRAMHKMTVHNETLFMFGGLIPGEQGIISDELVKMSPIDGRNAVNAELINFETKPTPRIAFNFHIVNMPIRRRERRQAEEETADPVDKASNEPIIKPVDDWKVTIDGENVALPDTGDSSTVQTNQTEVDPDNFDSMALLLIHGGCDSEGEFFNDVFVATIP